MIAAYIRVSTDEQADKGNSLFEQQERLDAYCKAQGWEVPTFYIDDGYSAKDLKRPQIQQLLNDVREKKVEIVITTKLDRLCRNLLDLLQTVKLLDNHNCKYVSSSESFDTSNSIGRMTLQLLGTFAEFERERISERVKDNMLSIAKNSDKVITQPCFGYELVDRQYVINEQEAECIRFMFEMAEQGHGHRMIAKMVNERGVTTKRNKPWDQINVKRLMNTETIAGVMVYNKRMKKNGKTVERDKMDWIIKHDNHPAIIPFEQWEHVQDIFRSRAKTNKHADSESYLLTGLVKCGHCGKNMKGSTARYKRQNGDYTYYRYICSSYVLGYGCKHHATHRDDLEQHIFERIKRLSEGSLETLRLNVATSHSVADEIKEIESQLAKLDKRMQKQIEAYEMDLISAQDLKLARIRIDVERNNSHEQIEQLKSKKGKESDVQENARRLLGDILGDDRVKSKASIRKLIDSIIVKSDENIADITWIS